MPETPPESDLLTLNDRDLLRRFVLDADEPAFAEIVRRYQGIVLGVCRRVIGNSTDVDDAFQATFIALARRPNSVRRTESLSSWLYTVAWRTSRRLVRQRRKHPMEPLATQIPEKPDDPLDRIASAQDCMVLDEELNDLPQKYRDVLVMTYFTSQSSQQIADELGVSKGTVDGRIRQARNMLRIRLARRGVAVGVLAVAASLSTGATASAAPALLESTLQLGAQTLSGSLPGTTDLSHLEPLIRPETAMMSTKLIVTGLLCVSAIAGIAGMNGLAQDGSVEGTNAESGDTPIDAAVDDATADPFAEAGSGDSTVVAKDSQPAAKQDSVDVFVTGGEGVEGDDGGFGVAEGPAKVSGRKYTAYPRDAAPLEKWLHDCLDKPVPNLDFPGEFPLSELLDTVSSYYSEKHGSGAASGGDFRMQFFPDHGELNLNQITSLEDITIHDISFDGMALRNVLKHVFAQTIDDTQSPVPLTYVVQDETILVTTKNKAESTDMLITRVYDVAELVDLDLGTNGFSSGGGFMSLAPQLGGSQPPVQSTPDTGNKAKKNRNAGKKGKGKAKTDNEGGQNMPGMGGSGFGGGGQFGGGGGTQTQSDGPVSLSDLVMEMTSPPCEWIELNGDGGAIRLAGNGLVVRQTYAGHQEIVRLLNLLHESVQQNQ